jgi:hypothetical protein
MAQEVLGVPNQELAEATRVRFGSDMLHLFGLHWWTLPGRQGFYSVWERDIPKPSLILHREVTDWIIPSPGPIRCKWRVAYKASPTTSNLVVIITEGDGLHRPLGGVDELIEIDSTADSIEAFVEFMENFDGGRDRDNWSPILERKWVHELDIDFGQLGIPPRYLPRAPNPSNST